MDEEQKKQFLERTVKTLIESKAVRERMTEFFGMGPEIGPVSMIMRLEDEIVSIAEGLLGEGWSGWLYWFVYDNECGGKGFDVVVGHGKEKVAVKTVDDLIRAVEYEMS